MTVFFLILDLIFKEGGRIFNEIARRFMGNIYIYQQHFAHQIKN